MKRSFQLTVLVCFSVVMVETQDGFAQTGSLFNNSGTTTGGGNTGNRGTGGQTGDGVGQLNTSAGTGGVNTDFGTGLVGRSGVGDTFVGNANAGQQAPTTNRNFGNGNVGRNQNRGGNTNRGGNQTQRAPIRYRSVVAFDFKNRPQPEIRTALQGRFTKLSNRISSFGDVQMQVAEGGTVVLRGQVESERTAKLIASYVRLEPGVRKVTNELTVKDSDTE